LLSVLVLVPVPGSAQDLKAQADKVIRRVLESLDGRHRSQLALVPFSLDASPLPQLRPGTNSVLVGEGFLRLTDHLALAATRDQYTEGYLLRFLEACSADANGIGELPVWNPPGVAEDRIENEHVTAFNQLVANLVSIEMAHHYLGQHEAAAKRNRNTAGATLALPTVISEGDNRKAIREGVSAAVHCGYTTESLQRLIVELGRTTPRPGWSPWFFPPKVSPDTLLKELRKSQDKALGN
jgi:hypothetical protein